MKLLAISTQFDTKERFKQNPVLPRANQAPKYDTISFGMMKIPDEALVKEVRALSDEFVKHLNDIEDAAASFWQKLRGKSKEVKEPKEAEIKEAAKAVDEAANNTLTFIKNLQTKPKKIQEEFALYKDEYGESHGHLAITSKRREIASALLDFIKTLDKPIQEKFANMLDSNSANHLHKSIVEGDIEFALKYIDFLDPLSEQTKAAVMLQKDGDGNSVFHTSLLYDRTDVTRKILGFVKKLDQPTQEEHAILENYDGESHFHAALQAYEPKIATDYSEFIKGLSDTAKKVFISHQNHNSESHFEAASKEFPQIALDFLDFALDIDPKKVPKFKISYSADSDFSLTAANKVLSCAKLEPAEKLAFLKNNNEEGQFDAMIEELEKSISL